MDEAEASRAISFFGDLFEANEKRQESIDRAYTGLRDLGLLSRVIVHRYRCRRGCQVAQAYALSGRVFLAVRDYKYSPGLNLEQSAPRAREKNTLDGEKHWPSHVYDMNELAEWGDEASAHVVCRHFRGTLTGRRVLADAEGVTPGHPGKPTVLATP